MTQIELRKLKSRKVTCTVSQRISPAEQVTAYLEWAREAQRASITVYPASKGIINCDARDRVYKRACQYGIATITELTKEQMEDYS